MSRHKKCSRNDCPSTNVSAEYTTNCGHCGNTVHLPCIGIHRKINDVLIHQNIRVFCGECSEKSTVGSHKVPLTMSIARPSFDSVVDILTEMQNVVRDTNAKVTASVNSSQSYAAVLKTMDEVKELTAKTNEQLNAPKKIAPRNIEIFPHLGSPAKRKRQDQVEPPPRTLAKRFPRTLTSGTSSDATHGLGEAVNSKPRLEKSIYVTKLPTDITIEALTEYIKKRVENVNENDFSLRMLVKKGADLSEKTFLSCRLACTEVLYEKFMDSAFWPSHVMIGEFIDRPRPTRPTASVNDFLTQSNETNLPNPSTSGVTATPKTATSKSTVLKEATLKTASKNGTPSVTMETS